MNIRLTRVMHMFMTAVAAIAFSVTIKAADNTYSSFYANLPVKLAQVEAPVFPDYKVSISDFGAVPDGVTKNTDAFARAMKHMADKGGGQLIVPAGIWYTGPIQMESNVNLHLEQGALILFSEDLADYPLVETSYEGLKATRCMSPLSAFNKKNIAVTGPGTINGNGQNWRPVKRAKMTDSQWKALASKGVYGTGGSLWFPNERIRRAYEDPGMLRKAYSEGSDEAWAEVHDFLRPVLVSFVGCENVLLRETTFENSPAWNVHPLMCTNVIVDGVSVRNPWYAQNGDGIDIESCSRVLLVNSSFDVGDDGICVKSGKDKDGRDRAMPTRDVLIEGCTVYHGHGGFVIGSEMSGGVDDVVVRNCNFIGTDVGLRFKSTRGRGGVVKNIWIDGVRMTDIAGEALIFDLYYGGKGNGPVPPVTEETPSFRDIHIDNTICRSARRAMYFNGLPEMPLTGIDVHNSAFYAKEGAVINEADGVQFDNVRIVPASGKPVRLTNVKNFVEK